MNLRILKLWRAHPIALLVELGLFAGFMISLFVMATLKTPVSTWAIIPHILCNLSLVTLLVRHRLQGRPTMYWTHFDVMVVVLFLYFAANVYYSEVRSISWESASLYMDALAAYFIGRMLFYHRVRLYTLLLVAGLGISFLGVYSQRANAQKLATSYSAQSEQAQASGNSQAARDSGEDFAIKAQFQQGVITRLVPVQRLYLLMFCFWGLTMVFLFLEKPSGLAFALYTLGMIAVFALYTLSRLNWLVGENLLSTTVATRNDKLESLRTAFRIVQAYPVTGGGLGTFPILFDAYRLNPASATVSGFNAYVYAAVETGIVGVLLLLYFLFRMPLHVIRRWRLFPNRRLRFAVLAHLLFFLMFVVQGFHDADLFRPAVWFPVWAIFGTFVSLVMVRDHVRIFESLVPAGRGNDPVAHARRVVYASAGSVFGRTPLARLPRPKMNFLRRYHISHLVSTVVITVVVLAFSGLEIAPYVANRYSRLHQGEAESSPQYGDRLDLAARIFPLDSMIWSKIGDHYSACIKEPLEIYQYADRIEPAYQKAIFYNPYRPTLYEQLYFLYRDINRSVDALQIMKAGVEANPNHLVLRLLLVRELEKVGSLALATYHVKTALFRIAPDKTELYLRLAELYELQGLPDQAKLYYQYARQVVPDSTQTRTRLQRLQQRLDLPPLTN